MKRQGASERTPPRAAGASLSPFRLHPVYQQSPAMLRLLSSVWGPLDDHRKSPAAPEWSPHCPLAELPRDLVAGRRSQPSVSGEAARSGTGQCGHGQETDGSGRSADVGGQRPRPMSEGSSRLKAGWAENGEWRRKDRRSQEGALRPAGCGTCPARPWTLTGGPSVATRAALGLTLLPATAG